MSATHQCQLERNTQYGFSLSWLEERINNLLCAYINDVPSDIGQPTVKVGTTKLTLPSFNELTLYTLYSSISYLEVMVSENNSIFNILYKKKQHLSEIV